MESGAITIFTDGSSRGNPGPGGFGAIVIVPKNHESRITNQEVAELGGREEHTTNNRMELQAAISALSFVSTLEPKLCILYTDSSYVINGITKWVFGWQKNNWVTATKKPVENRDLWEKLFELVQGKQIQWKQVGGHVGVRGNERCDEIATAFADNSPIELYSGVLENYRIKNILDIGENATASASKKHSNAKAFSYVSLVDGKVLIHKTWAECEARVKGKKAKYKKVLSKEEEMALVSEWGGRN